MNNKWNNIHKLLDFENAVDIIFHTMLKMYKHIHTFTYYNTVTILFIIYKLEDEIKHIKQSKIVKYFCNDIELKEFIKFEPNDNFRFSVMIYLRILLKSGLIIRIGNNYKLRYTLMFRTENPIDYLRFMLKKIEKNNNHNQRRS